MPVVHKSTIRRARQSEKRRLRNRATLSSVRSVLRKVQEAIAAKKPDEAKALELNGWSYPRHLAGRLFAVFVHGVGPPAPGRALSASGSPALSEG